MNSKDIHNLREAYLDVYEEVDKRRAPKELLDRLNASREGYMAQDGPNKPAYDAKQRLLKKAQKRKNMEEQTDLYDLILSHLLDEGYADTNESALAIMGNMSEDWRESIVEKFSMAADPSKPQSPKRTKLPKSRERNIGTHNDWNDKPTEWGELPPAAKKLRSRAIAVVGTQRRQDKETGVT